MFPTKTCPPYPYYTIYTSPSPSLFPSTPPFILPLPIYGHLVLNCTPCHALISSFNTPLTSLCCFNTLNPRNFSEQTSIPNMLPQPPLISWTCSVCGSSAAASLLKILSSASERSEGGMGVLEDSEAIVPSGVEVVEEEAAGEERCWGVEERVRRAGWEIRTRGMVRGGVLVHRYRDCRVDADAICRMVERIAGR
jgi:hypothetical protein